MKIVFFGTPDFAVPVLRELTKKHEVALVVTKPDAKKKRGQRLSPSAVKKAALEENLEVITPSILDECFLKKIQDIKADVFVVVAYGKILSEELIHSASYGAINIHASLLPKYRGASPIQSALLNGDSKSGVTIMNMIKELDAGDILLQKEIDITSDNLSSLHDRLSLLGTESIIEVLGDIEYYYSRRLPQDDASATYCKKISKSDGLIDWRLSATEIYNKVRAFTPLVNVYTFLEGNRLIVTDAEPVDKAFDAKPGTVISVDHRGISVCCGKKVLLIKKIKVPGKREMLVKDYLKGNIISEDIVLGG